MIFQSQVIEYLLTQDNISSVFPLELHRFELSDRVTTNMKCWYLDIEISTVSVGEESSDFRRKS